LSLLSFFAHRNFTIYNYTHQQIASQREGMETGWCMELGERHIEISQSTDAVHPTFTVFVDHSDKTI
jgi:hypothetical protein